MNRPTQGLLMAFLGAVMLRLALTDAYLRYVTEWMKWPIAISGLLLVLLALDPILRRERDDDHHAHGADGAHGVPAVTWLLVVPGLVSFVVSPPELGSFLAERRSGDTVTVAEPAVLSSLDATETVEVDLSEFIWRAQEGGTSLEGQPVTLTGFVSYDGDDHWYVTRMSIGCCAADAVAYRVRVDGQDAPARDQWVEVTGVYADGSGVDPTTDPVLDASEVTEVAAPRQTYE